MTGLHCRFGLFPMKITIDVRLPFPRSTVYTTYRDKMLDLVPYLPNVRAIELQSRREMETGTQLITVWHGGGSIPVPARAFLSEDLLSWTDYSTWKADEFVVDWRTETHAFTEAVRSTGRNRFIEEGNGTRIESRGELHIDTQQLKGIPSFIAGSIAQTIEDLLGQQIGTNFQQMGTGAVRYLQKHH